MNSVRAVFAITILFVLSTVSGVGIVGAQDGGQDPRADSDTVVIGVDVAAGGNTEWSVEYRVLLDSENKTQAFDELQADIKSNRSAYEAQFDRRMSRTVQTAENETGRQMSVSNVSVTTEKTSVPREYGVVEYTFIWEGFAETEQGTVRVGDALSGFFLDGDTRFTMNAPSNYVVVSESPGSDSMTDGSVTWIGPHEFGNEFLFEASVSEDSDQEDSLLFWTGVAGLAAIAFVGVILYWLHNPKGNDSQQGVVSSGGSGGSDGGSSGSALLSDGERVIELLAENGGRVKQQTIVEETEWTAAKTSKLLTRMEEDGDIQKLRVGRENIIAEPDVDLMNQ